MTFSDYIVFADESGDHGLVTIDPQFPVFALVSCVFEKERYAAEVEPVFRRLKFKWFGHDAAILHEREIRKQTPPFDFLRRDAEMREAFMADVDAIMAVAPFHAYVSVIDKVRLRQRYPEPRNPYDLAMFFCLEKLSKRLVADGQEGRRTHVLFEARGKAEDSELKTEFQRIVTGQRPFGFRAIDFERTPLEPIFVPKAANLAGHQLTDLIARPLALRALRPGQRNRAAELIAYRVKDLKIFP